MSGEGFLDSPIQFLAAVLRSPVLNEIKHTEQGFQFAASGTSAQKWALPL
jgi:hypothetical protein